MLALRKLRWWRPVFIADQGSDGGCSLVWKFNVLADGTLSQAGRLTHCIEILEQGRLPAGQESLEVGENGCSPWTVQSQVEKEQSQVDQTHCPPKCTNRYMSLPFPRWGMSGSKPETSPKCTFFYPEGNIRNRKAQIHTFISELSCRSCWFGFLLLCQKHSFKVLELFNTS